MRLTRLERTFLVVSLITFSALAAGQSIFEVRLVLDTPSADTEPLPFTSPDGQTMVLNVQRSPLLDHSDVQSATVAQDSDNGQPRIQIMLNPHGQERLADVSRQNLHKRVAVVIDGKVWVAPIIQAELTGGAVPIQGAFTSEQATDLARKINAEAGRR
ncbi:MAG TPA: hypothetical protein VKU19_36015 [Bryobacteraceae bacterium]|nr:hypothetical protein [Bryobacteraceae bacterium]